MRYKKNDKKLIKCISYMQFIIVYFVYFKINLYWTELFYLLQILDYKKIRQEGVVYNDRIYRKIVFNINLFIYVVERVMYC